MAQVVVTECDDYQRAVQYMIMDNGCDETKIDWTPPAFPIGATFTQGDFTAGNGTNRGGSGQCALYDPRGGNMIFKPIPSAAIDTSMGLATSGTNDSGVNEIAFAGLPFFLGSACIYGKGVCAPSAPSGSYNSAVVMTIMYINAATCQQINSILQINRQLSSLDNAFEVYFYSLFHGYNLTTNGSVSTYSLNYSSQTTTTPIAEGCGPAHGYNPLIYAFSCPVMIR